MMHDSKYRFASKRSNFTERRRTCTGSFPKYLLSTWFFYQETTSFCLERKLHSGLGLHLNSYTLFSITTEEGKSSVLIMLITVSKLNWVYLTATLLATQSWRKTYSTQYDEFQLVHEQSMCHSSFLLMWHQQDIGNAGWARGGIGISVKLARIYISRNVWCHISDCRFGTSPVRGTVVPDSEVTRFSWMFMRSITHQSYQYKSSTNLFFTKIW